MSNMCLASGVYTSFDGISNPSIVCDAVTPNCCESDLYSSIGLSCNSGYGICQNTGAYYCSGVLPSSNVLCSAVSNDNKATIESCNGLDDDCDGEIDEDFGVREECHTDEGIGEYECEDESRVYCKILATNTPTNTLTYTPIPIDTDGDGVPDEYDKCPGKDDNETFVYDSTTGTHALYFRAEPYSMLDDTDGDGIINCLDECPFDDKEEDDSTVEDLSKEGDNGEIRIRGAGCEQIPTGKIATPTVTSTYTKTVTLTNTQTFSNTFTNTNTSTPEIIVTSTNTPEIVETLEDTPTYTQTNTLTNTPSNTFTNTYTYTNTPTPTVTFTNTTTFTTTPTITLTSTFTPYIVPTIEVITPRTELPSPGVKKEENNKILVINLPKINYGALKENQGIAKAKIRYVIHIRKLKRLGVKDKYYKLGKKILTYKRKNKYNIKQMDRGIYSVRYQVVIIGKNQTKYTKWSKRKLIEI